MYTTMLELAISMVFLFLMLSAASSAIQEIIANIFRWRAKTLENGIAGLLRSEEFKNKLYNLPLLQGLCSPNARGQNTHRPSYIPSGTFALAVLQLAEQERLSLSNTPSTVGGSSALAEAVLRPLLRGANDVAEQKKRLEGWFDNSMDRVSGWYKRRSHAALWIIGALLCVFVNADSISLANAFWNDPTLRSATVTAATEYVKNPKQTKPGDTDSAPKVAGPKGNAPAQPVSTTPPANNAVPPDTGADAAKGKTPNPTQPGEKSSALTADDPLRRLGEVRRTLTNVNIPLGWCWNGSEGELLKQCFPSFNNPVQFTFKGTRRQKKYYYWIVSNYPDGKTSPSGPFVAMNGPDKLDDKNYIVVNWQAVHGATSYDILHTPDSNPPSGNCGCAVGTAVTRLGISDQSETLSAYAVEKSSRPDEPALPDPRMVRTDESFWWLWKVVGIALTALAISQGAPFWFDVLQKAVNLRLAGDAPDEKQKKKA